MPIVIELPEDIASEIANKLGIYGACPSDESSDCACRCHFESGLAQRMRDAVHAEDAREAEALRAAKGGA